MLGFAYLTAPLGEDECDFLKFRVDAVFVLEVHDVALDDVAIAVDDLHKLFCHYFLFRRLYGLWFVGFRLIPSRCALLRTLATLR